jgi:hypothetical protein
MRTYFSTNLKGKSLYDKIEVFRELAKLPENTLATIQWNISDDTLYVVSSLDPTVKNASDEGHIWTFLSQNYLLEEVIKSLGD